MTIPSQYRLLEDAPAASTTSAAPAATKPSRSRASTSTTPTSTSGWRPPPGRWRQSGPRLAEHRRRRHRRDRRRPAAERLPQHVLHLSTARASAGPTSSDMHELYCAGHLHPGGRGPPARHRQRRACSTSPSALPTTSGHRFGPPRGKRPDAPRPPGGRDGPRRALPRDRRASATCGLAQFFVDARGRKPASAAHASPGPPAVARHGPRPWARRARALPDAGAADLCAETGERRSADGARDRLWDDLTDRQDVRHRRRSVRRYDGRGLRRADYELPNEPRLRRDLRRHRRRRCGTGGCSPSPAKRATPTCGARALQRRAERPRRSTGEPTST